jgi:hypothetical protein
MCEHAGRKQRPKIEDAPRNEVEVELTPAQADAVRGGDSQPAQQADTYLKLLRSLVRF